ncbi:NAD kinase 2, mitochondrial-like isoform X2 [Belonocnema kinseyi]|uniref:NAD kinase 2, mitochondrial-like isoform X2 n=1 Tax=Belonocnema kinseyi TaxID=2817044 RepID=UPI00143CDA83|nr:NAD kinase 2, mitochondrial-like isoform X2 [Belonocnema kinseyi]
MSRWIPRQVLVLSKLTPLELLKFRNPDIKEKQLLEQFSRQGKNPIKVLHEHRSQLAFEAKVIKVLRKFKINFRFTKRMVDASKYVDWADFVITTGGDGTFLAASKLIRDNITPLMGFNSTNSSSNLTLPTQYTENVEKAFKKLFAGAYKLVMRSRIRTVMYGKGLYSHSFLVNEKNRTQGEKIIDALIRSTERKVADAMQPQIRILPWLALNEVFIGEFVAAKRTTLIIQVDNNPQEYKFRSSGLCVCTGSGSRSWFRAINFKGRETIQEIVALATNNALQLDDKRAALLMQKYLNHYVFDPEEQMIAYKIRELHRASTWPKPKDLQDVQI